MLLLLDLGVLMAQWARSCKIAPAAAEILLDLRRWMPTAGRHL